MKRFYYLFALLLIPGLAFAQAEEEITEACSDDPKIGYYFGEIVIDNTKLAGQYVAGGLNNADDGVSFEFWGDTTGLITGLTGEIVVAESPGGTILQSGAVSDPDEACEEISNPDALSGKIALIRRGACSFSLKADYAQMAGAAGFIVYNDERDTATDFDIINMTGSIDPEGIGVGSASDVTIPGVFIPRFLGDPMRELVQDFGTSVVATIRYPQCYIDKAPVANEDTGVVTSRELSAAYPNPFASRTQFDLAVEETQNVSVRVFNVLGQEVANLHEGALPTGVTHTFTFEGADLPAGVYLYRVVGETFSSTRQVTLVR